MVGAQMWLNKGISFLMVVAFYDTEADAERHVRTSMMTGPGSFLLTGERCPIEHPTSWMIWKVLKK